MKKTARFPLLAAMTVASMSLSVPRVLMAQDPDEPDLAKEARFHRIYKSYNESPTPEERWQSAVSSATAQTYTVQDGDTLWSLSETLFGDSQFWPKVWSINNSKIENPHLILPTQRVQFLPGTLGEAPSLSVVDGVSAPMVAQADGTQAPPAAEEAPSDLKTLLSRAPVPESTVKTMPLAGLPASLPAWKFKEDRRQVIDLDISPINRNFGSPEQNLEYFVTEADVNSLGEVTETELAMGSASEFQYVYVKLPKNSSGKFLVVRQVDKIKDPYSWKSGELVQVQGELQVVENVNLDDDIYRAIVLKTISPVEVGSKILTGELPKFTSKDEGNPSSASVRVIGGAHSHDRKLFGLENLVILNGGSSQGISSGQTLSIYRQQTVRSEKSDAIENARLIGKAKVIRVSEGFATAVVINAADDIQVGDSTSANIK